MDPIISLAIIVVVGAAIISVFVYYASKHKCEYGTVQDDGFQYCDKCHTARQPIRTPCVHSKWIIHSTENITVPKKDILTDFFETDKPTYAKNAKKVNIIGKVYVQKCDECGDLKITRFGINE